VRLFLIFLCIMFRVESISAQQPVLKINNTESIPGETLNVPLVLEQAKDVIGFQFDVEVPKTLAYQSFTRDVKLTNWSVGIALVNPQLLRIVGVSVNQSPQDFTGEAIFNLKFSVKAEPEKKPWAILNALLVKTGQVSLVPQISTGEHITKSPRVSFPQTVLDLGRIAIGETRNQTLTIQNTGTQTLSVTSLVMPFPGVSLLTPLPLQVPPSTTSSINLAFSPPLKGSQEGKVILTTNDPSPDEKSVTLKANYYAINQLSIVQGNGKFNGTYPLKIKLKNTENISALQVDLVLPTDINYVPNSAKFFNDFGTNHQITAAQSGNELRVVIFSPSNMSLPKMDSDFLSLDLNLKATPGTYSVSLTKPIAALGNEEIKFSDLFNATIQVTSSIIEAATTIPRGSVPLGQKNSFSYTIKNNGAEILTLSQVANPINGLTLLTPLPVSIAPFSSGNLSFEFTPTSLGNISGSLRLINSSSNASDLPVAFSANVVKSNFLILNNANILTQTPSKLKISTEFESDVSAIQFDLSITPTVELLTNNFKLVGVAASTHQLSVSRIGAGNYRILVFSFSNQVLPKGKIELLEIGAVFTQPNVHVLKASTITASTASGNIVELFSEEGRIVVTVIDLTPPQIKTKNIVKALSNTGKINVSASDFDNGTTDDIQLASISLSKTEFTCINLGANAISFTATDASGNTSTSEVIVTVVDEIKPTLETKTAFTLKLDAEGKATLRWEDLDEGSSDNCSIKDKILSKTSFTCADLGANKVTFTATDASGNTSSMEATITVVDEVKPTLKTKSNYILTLDSEGKATLKWEDLDDGSSDNCRIKDKILSKTSFTCAEIGINKVTFTATDASGNTATAEVTITVVDEIKPILKVKAAYTIKLDPEGKAALKWEDLDEGSSDNCSIKDKILSKTSFTCADLGSNKVTFTVTDASGNTSTSEVIVTVVDEIKPTLETKTAFTLKLDAEGKATLRWEDLDEGSSDNCSIKDKILSKTSFTCADLGANKVTFTATDASGNTSSMEATITVVDEVKPTLKTKSNYILTLDSEGKATLKWEDLDDGSSDNCSIKDKILSKTSFTCAEIGINKVTFTATDASGNTATAEVTITVVDEIKPILKVKAAYTIKLDPEGKAALKWEDLDEGSSDNCSIKDKILSKTSFTCADLGSNKVTFTVTDASGNTSTSEVIVTVVDEIKPTLETKTAFTLKLDAEGKATLRWEDLDEGSSDNCSIKDKILSKTSFTCADLGANKVTFTATDASGNTSSMEATITVVDEVKPTLKTKSNYILTLDSEGKATLKWEDLDDGSSDNCRIKDKILSKTSFTCAEIGINKVTFTATDASGNTATAEVTITVVDEIKPILKVKAAYTIKLDPEGKAALKWEDLDEGSSDNCSIKDKILSKTSFTCADLGSNKVTFTVTDASGNTSTSEVIVTVVDEIKPTLETKTAFTLKLDAEGKATLRWEDLDESSSDNCSIKDKLLSKTSFTCADLGANKVTFTAKDASGNTATAEVTVTVVDEVKPTLKTKSNFTLKLDAEGKAALKWEDLDDGSSDNCRIKDKILSKTSFTCEDLGTNKVTYTATDASGNTSTAEVTFTVVDEIKPILKAKSTYTIKLDVQGKASLKWEEIDEGSTDNCNIKDRTLSKTDFTRTDGGDNKVTYTITDTGGKTSSIEVTVRVDILLSAPERANQGIGVKAYPNPVSDYLYLEFAEGISTSTIRGSSLVDASGRVLGEIKLEEGSGGQLGFPTRALKTGMYFLRLSTHDTLQLIKFTVIH
jgi:acyl dehydratase